MWLFSISFKVNTSAQRRQNSFLILIGLENKVADLHRSFPSRHITLLQCWINVETTSCACWVVLAKSGSGHIWALVDKSTCHVMSSFVCTCMSICCYPICMYNKCFMQYTQKLSPNARSGKEFLVCFIIRLYVTPEITQFVVHFPVTGHCHGI